MLLAAVMTLALVACGGDTNPGTDTPNTDAPGDTTTPDSDTNDPAAPAEPNAGEEIKNLVLTDTGELTTLFRPHAEGATEDHIIRNLVVNLLEFDNHGKLQPSAAESWGTEDGGQTWTFHLRDDVTWVDVNGNYKADVVADDWATTLEWILNYHKNDAFNTSMCLPIIEGAQEYYDYTQSLTEEEALALDKTKFFEMVGIECPDERTIVYHCTGHCTYFDTMCINPILYPTSQKLIDELGVENVVGMSNEQMWYSGAYTLTTYIPNNEKVLTRNPAYFDKDCKLFDTVTIRVVESALVDDQLWETGEVDYTDVSESTLSTIMSDPNNKWNDYLVESRLEPYATNLLFNYNKMNEDGTPDTNWNTAVANEAFRKSIYWGLDLTNIWYSGNPINPLNLESLGFTCKDFVFFENGDDYSSHVISQLDIPESDGKSPRRYQPDKAEQFKQQAMEELSAKGVTFPITIDYYIKAGVETAVDTATIMKEIFEALGTDYITFNIKTFVSSYNQEVSTPALDCFSTSMWGADFLDVSNWLDQCLYQNEAALYSKSNMHLDGITDPELIEQFTTFTNMVYAAEGIYDDMDARNQAFADAEAYLINHALVIPWSYRCYWTMTKINEYSKSYSGCGIGWQFKNWETSTEPYTTEQYAQFVTDYYG
jgi:oligopeptide transport system substrate-binding protein